MQDSLVKFAIAEVFLHRFDEGKTAVGNYEGRFQDVLFSRN